MGQSRWVVVVAVVSVCVDCDVNEGGGGGWHACMQWQEVIWIMIYSCLVMLGLTMHPRYRRRKRGRAGGSVSQLVGW